MIIQQGKTNWILIIAVVLIAGAAGGGLVMYINETIRQESALSQTAELKKSEKPLDLPINREILQGSTLETATTIIAGQPVPFDTRDLSAKEYQLNYSGKDLFTVDGPITVKEILNCSVPDLSTGCPEISFIGKQSCDGVANVPIDCVDEGNLIKGTNPSCIYKERFEGTAAGTLVGSFNGLVVRSGKCFLVSWDLIYQNCEINGDCATQKAQIEKDNTQILSAFKFIGS